MNKENGCKWYFGPEGGSDNGPTSPTKGTFRSLPDINVVREAIQNSLDVPADATKPVVVEFTFGELKSAEFPKFFEIREHIKASLAYYAKTDRAKEKFPSMIAYLSKDVDLNSAAYASSIGVITISDSNTRGMDYAKDDHECSFYAFFHSTGVSVCKGEGSGGSNGLGKETLYNRSEIKTLLLSTRNLKGAVVFQGASKLTTHLDPKSQKKVTAFGYYGKNEDEPITIEADIPECFRRQEVGTDIHIVGVDLKKRDQVRNQLIEAVLNHFWLAVLRKKLVVIVDDVQIDDQTIGHLIGRYFKDNRETKTDKYERWNARPYYNAVLHVDAKREKTAFEETELPTVGHVRLYIDWSAEDLPKRIAFMRQPRMVIFKKPRKALPSFVAVFVCDNDVGNRVLRCVEPPAHDEWNVDYYEGPDTEKHKQGIAEVEKFVMETLDKHLRPKPTTNEIIIPGLAELLPDANEKSIGGERGTVGSGASEGLQPSGNVANKETGAPVSFIPDPSGVTKTPTETPAQTGNANGLVDDTATSSDGEGEPTEIIGVPTNDSEGGSGGGLNSTDSNTVSNTKTVEKKGSRTHVKIKVLMTPMFFRKDGVLWHRIIVRPDPKAKPKAYACVRLYVTTGSDNNSQDTTAIIAVDGLPAGAFFEGNCIADLDMQQGARFDVRFDDSIVHSVKVVAYASK